MAKHVGIVAVSAEGAALCYRTLCAEGAELLGDHMHPEVSVHTFPLGQYMRGLETGGWEHVGELMLSSARRLAAAGADFLICPDNTVHEAFDGLVDRSPLPWLHIAEVVAAEAARRGFERVGVLGTRSLMEGPVYPSRLADRGIEHRLPDREDRERIDATIFEELVHGRFEQPARSCFGRIIDKLRSAAGCDAVVLGCTEIPLLVSPADSTLPILDSTRLLARAALREAMGSGAGDLDSAARPGLESRG